MEEIREIIEEIRKAERSGEDDTALCEQLSLKLKTLYIPILHKCNREDFLISGDAFSMEDAFIMEHRYETVFIDEVAECIEEVDAHTIPTETYLAIFECMIDNEITCYKQDW